MKAYKGYCEGVSGRKVEVPFKNGCACETDMRKYLHRTVSQVPDKALDLTKEISN